MKKHERTAGSSRQSLCVAECTTQGSAVEAAGKVPLAGGAGMCRKSASNAVQACRQAAGQQQAGRRRPRQVGVLGSG